MFSTVWAVVSSGKIEPVEPVVLPEGSRVLVTLLSDAESEFWLHVSQKSLDAAWDNPEDEVYAQLLEKGVPAGTLLLPGCGQLVVEE